MEKQRKIKQLTLMVMIVAVLGLTVAYAALSSTLNITGAATLDAATWKLEFNSLSAPVLTGGAKVVTAPTITGGTTLGTYNVTLTKPGDSVKYTFNVKNAGTINAKISSFTKAAKPTCTSPTGVTIDATTVCNGLTYTLVYTDTKAPVAQNDVLAAGQTRNLTLTLAFDGNALPSNDVSITNLGITIIYTQN